MIHKQCGALQSGVSGGNRCNDSCSAASGRSVRDIRDIHGVGLAMICYVFTVGQTFWLARLIFLA